MKILLTGSDGFIGKNLKIRLQESSIHEILYFTRKHSLEYLDDSINKADFIVHLAGENRPEKEEDYMLTNVGLTKEICNSLKKHEKKIPIIFASSTQAELDNIYGRSKLQAESTISELHKINDNPVLIYRLPGVYGKWSRPNYNSVVATFCHNIAKGIPIRIDNPNHILKLIYIDDVVLDIEANINNKFTGFNYNEIKNQYSITIKDLADNIYMFKNSRNSLITNEVGTGFERTLYATFMSYFDKDDFVYSLKSNVDDRGNFVEMLKTKNSGQFSFFTAHPGITRGGHYHHTKSEKFLVIKGNALFKFRNIITDEKHEVFTDESEPVVVETIPGWSHDITNVGNKEMIVMLWANEIFDHENPDTFPSQV